MFEYDPDRGERAASRGRTGLNLAAAIGGDVGMTKSAASNLKGEAGAGVNRRLLIASALVLGGAASFRIRPAHAGIQAAATLVMIEEVGCPYCRRWHAEVGPAYANSPEGRFAPLLRMDINAPERRAFNDVRFTPTFVLVKGASEVGRIVGYPGQDFFWPMLEGILAKAGYVAPPEPAPAPADQGGART